ncbi:MAG: PASTA domain-containing protein [Gemmatimonadales bacterium]
MRIRRHTGSGFGAESGTDAPEADESAAAESRPDQGDPWRRFARDLGIVAAVAAVGYGISGYWISPDALGAEEHAVPRVLELPAADARERLTDLGFRVRMEGERSNPAVPRGAIVWQDPPPDMVVPPNSSVQLVVSGGPAPVNVPDVVGLSLQYAEGILEAAGMKVGRVDRVTSGQEADVVLSVRPPPGNGRPRGSTVELLVSAGQGGGE